MEFVRDRWNSGYSCSEKCEINIQSITCPVNYTLSAVHLSAETFSTYLVADSIINVPLLMLLLSNVISNI